MSSAITSGMNAAYRLLSYRDRSVMEIRRALKKKEFGSKTIEQVIGNLLELGYLNDKKFAKVYGESMARAKHVGPNYVKQKLMEKGVDRDTALDAIDNIFKNSKGQEEEISNWIEKKLRSVKKDMPAIKKKKRIYDFLLRKGFNHQLVYREMNKWEFN